MSKLLVLTKRHYMGKDLLNNKFGRFWELPQELAKLGHIVQGVCLNYQNQNSQANKIFYGSESIIWHPLSLHLFSISSWARYWKKLVNIANEFRPDIIWACSDAFHAIIGVKLANHIRLPCVVDLYDNFESYPATWLPGVFPLFKRAVKNANGITCVSHALADKIAEQYSPSGLIIVLENAINKHLFYSQNRSDCRKHLKLPLSIKLIGTAGALYANRGIDILYRGFNRLTEANTNIHLVVAGPRKNHTPVPRHPRIHDLGILRHDQIPVLINALDVAAICNRDSAFGRYCFPQKLYEILACRRPLVAAEVGAVRLVFRNYTECLYEPGDVADLMRAVKGQLQNPFVPDIEVLDWSDLAKRLEAFFKKITANGTDNQHSAINKIR